MAATSEPSGLVIFGVLFGLIVGILLLMWLAQELGRLATWENVGRAARWVWGALNPPQTRQIAAGGGDRPARAARSRAGGRRMRRRPQPLRSTRGRFAGSLPASNTPGNEARTKLQAGNEGVTASGSGVTTRVEVTTDGNDVTVSAAEAAIIAMRLTQGMSPSAVTKSLPGYSPRNYSALSQKVAKVKAELDQAGLAGRETQPTPAA